MSCSSSSPSVHLVCNLVSGCPAPPRPPVATCAPSPMPQFTTCAPFTPIPVATCPPPPPPPPVDTCGPVCCPISCCPNTWQTNAATFHGPATNLTNAQMVAQASAGQSGVRPGQYFGNQLAAAGHFGHGGGFGFGGGMSGMGGAPMGGIALASSQAGARDLDAADGVIDGKHFGTKVGVSKTGKDMTLAESQAQARALDAADGKIDGQHFGSKIGVQRPPSVTGGNVAIAHSQAEARALDAADGRIDGRHFGSQVAVQR